MSVTPTPLSANATNFGFSPGTWTVATGTALGTGDIWLFLAVSGSSPVVGAVTIGGVTATPKGTVGAQCYAFCAVGVNTATGNISIVFTGAPDAMAANWFLVTGGDASSAVLTGTNKEAFNMSTAPAISGSTTILSGGAGLAMFYFASPTTHGPYTWTGCVGADIAALHAIAPSGNGAEVSGNYITAAGATTVTADAPVFNMTGQSGDLVMVAIPATGGGGSALVTPTRRVFVRRRRPDFSGWNPVSDRRTRSLIVPTRKLILPSRRAA